MSSLHPNTPGITIYSYDLMRDESDTEIRKLYLQRIIHEHLAPIKQLPKILTPRNTDLFSRSIYFLKKADILALPASFQTNGWARFFEAMYFAVSPKSCPASMSSEERDAKTVDLDETIRILNDLIINPSTDPQLLPIIHNTLGIFCFRAIGVVADPKKAFSYFQTAATAGLAQAHIYLGTFYGNGISVKQDITTAIAEFKLAVKMGSIEALYHLGNILALGKDKIESSTPYFAAAAAKKHPTSLFWMGYLASEQAKSKSISKKNRRAYEVKTVNYYKEAAELDCIPAQLALGQAYVHGYLGLPKKENHAIRYLKAAAQNRSAEGATHLGVVYTKSLDPSQNQYDTGFSLFLKACRYSSTHMQNTVGNINNLLQRLEKSSSPEDRALGVTFSRQMSAYIRKHKLAINKEQHTVILSQSDENQQAQIPHPQDREEGFKAFVNYGQTLRHIYVKTLSPEAEKLFLEEEAARPERSKELIDEFLVSLNHFSNLYTNYTKKETNPEIDFITFVNTTASWSEETQTFLLSRLYLLTARDIFYLLKILGKQHFFDQLVSAIPFHKWENKKIVTIISMMLFNYYLRILAEDFTQVGKLMNDPVSELNKLSEACYWDMCNLVNFSKKHQHRQGILERLMVITMTYHMTQKSTDAHTLQQLKIMLVTEILSLPDLKEEECKEFDESLEKYRHHAPIILENLIKLGILNIRETVSTSTKTLKNHSQVNECKIKLAAIVAFFNERYAHFHAERLEAERKAKEEAQALKAKEQAEKEATLRKILKEKVLKAQNEILVRLQKDLDLQTYGETKTRALQEGLERLQTLHQKMIDCATYSQSLKDKFLKTQRKIADLMAM